ncbi:hypothetical protein A2U01_0066027, partial [Trifolium medium]|nr:hypothetical protein [Trifolium medium]
MSEKTLNLPSVQVEKNTSMELSRDVYRLPEDETR